MKIRVEVFLKNGVLDVQGKAVEAGLNALGLAKDWPNASQVRVGKVIEFDLATDDEAKAVADTKSMCEQMLANTVIESYAIKVV